MPESGAQAFIFIFLKKMEKYGSLPVFLQARPSLCEMIFRSQSLKLNLFSHL